MAQTTIYKEAQILSDTYYRITAPNDDTGFGIKYFSELISQELAVQANIDARQNSNDGESAYSNDQFITTFNAVPILTDDNGNLYSVMPSTPASLPNGREIAGVSIDGNNCMEAVPIKNHSAFTQSLIGYPSCFVTFKVEGGNIIYKTANALFSPPTATIKLVGATGSDLLNSPLNAPKNYLSKIRSTILAQLLPLKQIPADLLNNGVSNPT